MNTKKLLTSLLVSLSLTACSSTEVKTTAMSPLPASAVCCSDFSQFPWIGLNSAEEIDFQIDSSSPVGHFSDGNSYFNAFKLSERSQKVRIRLSSFMSDGAVIAPKVLTLDEEFNVVSTATIEQFDIKTYNAFTRSQLQLNFELDAAKTPYFIIYSSAEYLGQSIKVKHPARVRAEELGEPMPMVTDPSYNYERFGKLKLSVKTMSLKPIKAEAKEVQAMANRIQPVTKPAQPETQVYYQNAITDAVLDNDITKALSLLEEAKVLGVKDAQTIFIKALEKKQL